jgi:PAS domain S-box-containing protein
LTRAECEFLAGNLSDAQILVEQLLDGRLNYKIDIAAASRLRLEILIVRGKHDEAVRYGLECLRAFGVDFPETLDDETVRQDFAAVFDLIRSRPVSELIDLPLMEDAEAEANLNLLMVLFAPTLFTNINLTCAVLSRMVELSIRKGNADATPIAYAWFGIFLGQVFHRFSDGYEFCKLANALVEKHNLVRHRARTYFAMEIAALWTQSIETAIDYLNLAFQAGVETSDITFACFSRNHIITDMLLRADPLGEVWQETLNGMEFVERAKFKDVQDVILSQQRFILNMQGATASFSSFSDVNFDEHAFEAGLGSHRMNTMVCWYWILKLEARVISGDECEALAAREHAERLLFSSPGHIQLLSYHFFGALAITSAWNKLVQTGETELWWGRLRVHLAQLQDWADHGSNTFFDKFALVSAEIARIEERQMDAIQWYEKAIRSAQDNGFYQSQGIASELAARFYFDLGLETNGTAHVRNARACFSRWGADGKVFQLGVRYPQMLTTHSEDLRSTALATHQLDMTVVVKASQALSGQTETAELIDKLMTLALRHGEADRVLLIVPHSDASEVVAEIKADEEDPKVIREFVGYRYYPETVIRQVYATHKRVVVSDVSRRVTFVSDPYFGSTSAKSVLCLPISRQGVVDAILYIENYRASHGFSSERILVLELLAAQAAISMKIARLYGDLRDREARIRRLVEANIVGIYMWEDSSLVHDANDAFLKLIGYEREDLVAGHITLAKLTPPEWEDRRQSVLKQLRKSGSAKPFERVYTHKSGRNVPVLVGAAGFEDGREQGVAFVLDLTERKEAERVAQESERRYREVQSELAHANRVATMGQLSASIAHEVRQPIAAVLMNAEAARFWLGASTPVVHEALSAINRISEDGNRAGEVINRLRAFFQKAELRTQSLDINDAIMDVVALSKNEFQRNDVQLNMQLAANLPKIIVDRVQMQQLVLNLLVNGIEALTQVERGRRSLSIATSLRENRDIVLTVSDTGPGVTADSLERIFEAFHTTKENGMGMGLAICRSIAEAHGGRLSAEQNSPHGMIFRLSLPSHKFKQDA